MQQLNCILLIDDDAITNFIHESLIKEMHLAHKVVVCQDGKMALEYLENSLYQGSFPDLIFVDLNMPVLDGFGFLKGYTAHHYHEHFASIVSVLTTSLNPSDIEKITQYNMVRYINKPLLPQTLTMLSQTYNGLYLSGEEGTSGNPAVNQ